MSTMKGKVTGIPQNETAYGTMYNVEVAGKAYGFGKYPPKFKVGDYIEFNADTSGRFPKMDYKTVKTIPAFEEAAEAAPAGRGGNSRSYGNDDKRQEVISRQAARNSAIAMFSELRQLEALPVPKTAKAGEKFDLYIGIVDKLTEEYFNYSVGKVVNNAKAATEVSAPADIGDDWEVE